MENLSLPASDRPLILHVVLCAAQPLCLPRWPAFEIVDYEVSDGRSHEITIDLYDSANDQPVTVFAHYSCETGALELIGVDANRSARDPLRLFVENNRKLRDAVWERISDDYFSDLYDAREARLRGYWE